MVGMDPSHVDAYLARIGADRSSDLAALQLAHLRAVPFENLSIHLGEPIVLSPDALHDKIVVRRRGGFCYELNGLFAELLTALGHDVERLSARVWTGAAYSVPFDHMALRVDGGLLVDVGFGRFADFPLRLDEAGEQRGFAVVPAGEDLDVSVAGEPQYRLDRRPYALADFAPTCWWQSTSPESHFTRSVTCSIATPGGRVTLAGDRLIVTEDPGPSESADAVPNGSGAARSARPGTRTERILADDDEIRAEYLRNFGFVLERLPAAPGRQAA
jgi:N-hydroxyarylamine O-acetyltransferase